MTKWLGVLSAIALLLAGTIPDLQAADKEITGDRVPTDKGELVIHPITHATFLMSWNGKVICVDPVGGAKAFQQFPRPDMVLITDIHGPAA